jgi:hypothetical protein
MAIANRIYLVEYDGIAIVVFTVKQELVAWLRRNVLDNWTEEAIMDSIALPTGWVVIVMPDGRMPTALKTLNMPSLFPGPDPHFEELVANRDREPGD